MSYSNGVFHCDTCPEHIEPEGGGFSEDFAIAKSKGWRAYMGPDKQWAHSCPSCTEDYVKSQ